MDDLAHDVNGAVGGSGLVEKARQAIPFLRERADEANALRRPPEDVRAFMKASGFSRLWMPRRYGGAEGRLRAGCDMLRELAHGCGSTAWITVQNALHNLMLANWPVEAQEDVWGKTPDVLVSGILIPGIGKATKVQGGYRLSGRWPFVSGVEVADWVIFTGDCHGADGKAEELHFVIAKDEIEVLDTWYTIGLKASSSQDVKVNDVFVPEHRTVTEAALKGGASSPAAALYEGACYKVPPYSIFGCFIGSAALGIAEAAVDHYISNARKRAATMAGGTSIASYTTQQVKVAEAQSAVLAARQLLYSVLDEAEQLAESGTPTTEEDRTRFRALAAYANKLAAAAGATVLEAGGGGVIYERNPVARCISDLTVTNRHITQNWDVNASTYGRALLGLPIENPMLED